MNDDALTGDLLSALANLASLEYQVRYIVNGTADEYVMPAELLEDVDGLISQAQRAENPQLLSGDQWTALGELSRFIEERSGEALSYVTRDETIDGILNGAVWKELRIKASLALQAFGIVIGDLSLERIESGQIRER